MRVLDGIFLTSGNTSNGLGYFDCVQQLRRSLLNINDEYNNISLRFSV